MKRSASAPPPGHRAKRSRPCPEDWVARGVFAVRIGENKTMARVEGKLGLDAASAALVCAVDEPGLSVAVGADIAIRFVPATECDAKTGELDAEAKGFSQRAFGELADTLDLPEQGDTHEMELGSFTLRFRKTDAVWRLVAVSVDV